MHPLFGKSSQPLGGKKYYFNKVTKQSKWTIPVELKLAREQAERDASQVAPADGGAVSYSSAFGTAIFTTAASTVAVSSVLNIASATPGVAFSQTTPTPTIPAVNPAYAPTGVAVNQSPIPSLNTVPATAGGTNLHPSFKSDGAETKSSFDKLQNQPLEIAKSMDGASGQDIEVALRMHKHGIVLQSNASMYWEPRKGRGYGWEYQCVKDEKVEDDELALVFANKQEAKSAFKALLESVNVQSDWSWDQAMRVIINDYKKRCLENLRRERKQAFNEVEKGRGKGVCSNKAREKWFEES